MKIQLSRRVLRAALAICVGLSAAAASAQAAAGAEAGARPRIGLALSGGGARGAAHVGVLKVLEELRVPVHCITGTSMGSIVGGSFAAGMTPAEMEKVINETDWDQVFTDRPPRAEISMRRKEDDYKTLFAPEFGLDERGFQLPKGIVAGVSIDNMMRRLARPAYGISDFSKLPIPFRTVATDIETGEAVVLDHGNLAKAMRASMSVPGAVAPVEIEGRLLVDGGLADNLHVELVRKTCADVVIAVNIQSPLLKRDKMESLVGVTAQLVNLLGKESVDRQLKTLTERDVLIRPELGDISSGSFERTPEAARLGEQAARAMADRLRRYSIPEAEYLALRQRQVTIAKELGRIDEIRVSGVERTSPEAVREVMQTRPGEPLDEAKIAADARRIYGRGDYESVDYEVLQEPGKQVLLVEPLEKSWGPNYLRFGLGLSSEWSGDSSFNLLAQYRMTALNRLGGEWLTEVQIGQQDRLFTEFYQPLDQAGNWFVAPYLRYSEDMENLYLGEDKIAEYEMREWRIGADFGRVIGTYGEARVGVRWRDIRGERATGSSLLPDFEGDRPEVRALVKLDQLDHVNFPRAGYRFVMDGSASFDDLGADQDAQQLTAEFLGVHSFGPHTVSLRAAGASVFDDEVRGGGELVSLGGPRRLSGLSVDQLRGTDLAYAALAYYAQVFKMPSLLGSGVYAGGVLEAGNVWNRIDGSDDSEPVYSAGAFVGADTFLGPVYLLWGFTDKGQNALWLTIGQR